VTGLPEGKKSLALNLAFQAADRTLTDEDAAKIRIGLLKRLEKEIGATLRGS
jgi:phenylalanyl-tRNA synthetase beta chain